MTPSTHRAAKHLAILMGVGACVAVALSGGSPGGPGAADPAASASASARSAAVAGGVTEIATADADAADAPPTWSPDSVMVRPSYDLDAIAAWSGATVLEPVGRSGLAVLQAPNGVSADALLATLWAEGLVAAGAPMGVTRGTGLRAIEAVQ